MERVADRSLLEPTIDAYGEGSPPTLDSSTPVTGWTVPFLAGNGIYASPAISLAELGVGGLGNLGEDGVMMPLIAWKGSPGGTLGSASAGSYTYDYNAHKLYIKVASNPNTSGKTYLASTLLFGVSAAGLSDVTVQNLHLTRFSLHGVDFSDCTRCSVKNLTISDGGGAVVIAPNTYAGNGVQWSGDSSYGVADGITIRNLLDSGISPQTFASGSNLHDIQIKNSTVDRVGFAGVEISLLSFGNGSSISNISISDLTITNADGAGAATATARPRMASVSATIRLPEPYRASRCNGRRLRTPSATASTSSVKSAPSL